MKMQFLTVMAIAISLFAVVASFASKASGKKAATRVEDADAGASRGGLDAPGFYAGWPNVFSALPVAKDVFEKRPH